MLGFLTMTFMLLMIGEYQEKGKLHHSLTYLSDLSNSFLVSVMKAAGVFGAITSFISYYIAASALYSPETGYIHLPVGELPKKQT